MYSNCPEIWFILHIQIKRVIFKDLIVLLPILLQIIPAETTMSAIIGSLDTSIMLSECIVYKLEPPIRVKTYVMSMSWW